MSAATTDEALRSDEEEARRLQQQFLEEYYQLSQQINSKPDQHNNQSSHTNNIQTPTESTEQNPNNEKQVMCLICHDHPTDYVILSMCSTPHAYCLECAEKLKSQNQNSRQRPGSNPQSDTITCPLCGAVTTLDPVRGLRALRRSSTKRQINFCSGVCELHNNQMFLYYCYECLEPLCLQCKSTRHSKHQHDTLDSAYIKCKSEAEKSLNVLSEKKKDIEKYHTDLKENLPKIKESAPVLINQLKEQISHLKELLNQKEVEMEAAIKQMETRKKTTISQEMTWCQQKLGLIDSAVESAQKVVGLSENQSPMEFFESVYNYQDEYSDIYTLPEKKMNKSMYSFPPLPTEGLEDLLSRMYYKENSRNIFGGYSNYGEYSDDEFGEF